MLERGLVQEYTSAMHGRVIFVSHEWLGWDHPDPSNEQFQALQQIIRRLMSGDISVNSDFIQQFKFKQNTRVDAEDWKAALPYMYVWMDYMSIPQMSVYDVAVEPIGTDLPKIIIVYLNSQFT